MNNLTKQKICCMVGEGNFFYKRNKRYVLENEKTGESINSKGNIVKIDPLSMVIVFVCNYPDDYKINLA